jgi:glycine hydroxymethyltransferase
VQPHSGANANLAVYGAVLNPGDTLLSMKLSHGGHLSHGDPASITGRVYRFSHYGVNPETERLDYDVIRDMARKLRPRMLVAGASSYPRLIEYDTLRAIAEEVSAYLLVDMAHRGLVAARVIEPRPHPLVTFSPTRRMPARRNDPGESGSPRRSTRSIFPGTGHPDALCGRQGGVPPGRHGRLSRHPGTHTENRGPFRRVEHLGLPARDRRDRQP